MSKKNMKVKSGLKNLTMLPSYFDYIFVPLKQKVRLRPELSPKFLSILGPNPARYRPEKPGPTYNSDRSRLRQQVQKLCVKSYAKIIQTN